MSILYLGQAGSVIFIVAITVDRFLTVCHPRLAKRYWRKRTAVCSCVTTVLLVVSLAFAIPAWFSYQVVEVESADEISYLVKRNEFGSLKELKAYNIWFNTLVTIIVPFPILAVLNGLIFKKVIIRN